MSQPNTVILQATRGDDNAWVLTFSEDPHNFSQIWLTIRKFYATDEADDSGAVVRLTLTGGITILDTQRVRADLSSAQALLLQAPRYVHDVQVLRSGKRYTTQRGPVIVGFDVTRS